MKYVVASNAAFDRIYFTDGRVSDYKAGGAGIHALTGIQLWTDDVQLVCGAGADYREQFGQWIDHNRIDTQAFYVRDLHNPMNTIYYQEDGERTDETVYGNEHYNRLDCDGDDLECYLKTHDDVKAVYTFKDDTPAFWDKALALKPVYDFRMMWEINAGICVPQKLNRITEILQQVEAFSINRREVEQLFGVQDEEAGIQALKTLPCSMILYRVGPKGLYVILNNEHRFFPSLPNSGIVDVTGCGNASSSSSFYAWAQGLSIAQIGWTANITSAFCLREYSAMSVDQKQKEAASCWLKQLMEEEC